MQQGGFGSEGTTLPTLGSEGGNLGSSLGVGAEGPPTIDISFSGNQVPSTINLTDFGNNPVHLTIVDPTAASVTIMGNNAFDTIELISSKSPLATQLTITAGSEGELVTASGSFNSIILNDNPAGLDTFKPLNSIQGQTVASPPIVNFTLNNFDASKGDNLDFSQLAPVADGIKTFLGIAVQSASVNPDQTAPNTNLVVVPGSVYYTTILDNITPHQVLLNILNSDSSPTGTGFIV